MRQQISYEKNLNTLALSIKTEVRQSGKATKVYNIHHVPGLQDKIRQIDTSRDNTWKEV